MKEIEFKNLKIDDVFVLGDAEYRRITDQRVSCCKVLNAVSTNDPNNKIQVKPLTMVQIND